MVSTYFPQPSRNCKSWGALRIEIKRSAAMSALNLRNLYSMRTDDGSLLSTPRKFTQDLAPETALHVCRTSTVDELAPRGLLLRGVSLLSAAQAQLQGPGCLPIEIKRPAAISALVQIYDAGVSIFHTSKFTDCLPSDSADELAPRGHLLRGVSLLSIAQPQMPELGCLGHRDQHPDCHSCTLLVQIYDNVVGYRLSWRGLFRITSDRSVNTNNKCMGPTSQRKLISLTTGL